MEDLRVFQLFEDTDEDSFIDCIASMFAGISRQFTLLIRSKGTLKDIVRLDIPGREKLTGVGVKKLVQSLPKLAVLDIDHCEGVGKDAVEWATSQGVKVSHRLTLF